MYTCDLRPFPSRVRELRAEARRLEWLSLAGIGSVVVVMVLASGSSQAMRAAWIEDALALMPPLLYLVALRYVDRRPTEEFPFGYERVMPLSFMGAALVLLAFGAYLILDAVLAWVGGESQQIGTMTAWGRTFWAGWPMLAALGYSVVWPLVLGRKKQVLAEQLRDRTLHTDATMNRDDWLTAVFAGLGVIGVALGFSWAAHLAAIVVGLQVTSDGVEHLREATAVLIDRRPRTVDLDDVDELEPKLAQAVSRIPWVEDGDVRIRELGARVIVEAIVVPREHDVDLSVLEEATRHLESLSWRIANVSIIVQSKLSHPRRAQLATAG